MILCFFCGSAPPVRHALPTPSEMTRTHPVIGRTRSRLKHVCILGRTRSGGVYYRVRSLPNILSSVPLPSSLPRVGGKVHFQLHDILFRSRIDIIITLAFHSAL